MRFRHVGAMAAGLLALAACGNAAAEACNEYLDDLALIVEPAGESLAARAEEFRSIAGGEVELDQLSSALAESAADVEVVHSEIADLGEPPPDLAEGVDLIVAGFTWLQSAFELDSLSLATNPEVLDEYGALTQTGVDLIQQGTRALGPCPT